MGTQEILTALAVEGLSFAFGDQAPLFRDLSFTLNAGETLAIAGASGSGKSTLLKTLNLLLFPTEGRLALSDQVYFENGRPTYKLPEIRAKIGMVFQAFHLFPNLTALGNMVLAQKFVLKHSTLVAEQRSFHIAKQLGILPLMNRYPESLSGGEQQRVALARALLMNPRVLMLDEVTSALDPTSSALIMKALQSARALPEYRAMAVIMVTHAIRYALKYADRIAFLHRGALVELHSADRFVSDAKAEAVQEYLRDAGLFG